ncbi:hypothetical protein WDW37_08935 [Bdellovibrionota bacterium FG-1]
MLPSAFLFAMFLIYAKGEISGAKLESLFRRLIVAIALLVAFPEISGAATGLEMYLVAAFGGEASLAQVFGHVATRAHEMAGAGGSNWLKVGQIGLTLIATLSFLILSVVRHFLDVLHLTTWNLLHVLGPISLIGCLFDSWQQVPKGIFAGMLELSLWKPVWVILARILIAIGFGESPADPSQWFDTAVMNFAVAGLIATTPLIVHGILSGTLASIGSSVLQTGLAGTGAFLATAPMRTIQGGISKGRHVVQMAGGRALSRMMPTRPQNGPHPTSGAPKHQQPTRSNGPGGGANRPPMQPNSSLNKGKY